MSFNKKLAARVAQSNSLLCVGLDPDVDKMPGHIAKQRDPLLVFNKSIISALADLVCAFKLNSAMYEAEGSSGIDQLQKSCIYLQEHYPDIPIILDFKRADIGNTNEYYARFAFDYLGVDAITINPYMGEAANEAFLKYKDKGIIVLCRTSNLGAGEFQDLEVDGKKLYRIVAEKVMHDWNVNNNCLLVVGSPYPKELAEIRQVLGDEVVFLVPGMGTQGGDAERTVKAGINSKKEGIIINSSREVIYASDKADFAEAARARALFLRDAINKYRYEEE
jgi:orotidine-5'-phosphate decarboxylase